MDFHRRLVDQIQSFLLSNVTPSISQRTISSPMVDMAPHLPPWKRKLIQDMINDIPLTTKEITYAAECTRQAVTKIRSNMKQLGGVRAPPKPACPQRSMTPLMLETLCNDLREHPYLYLMKWHPFSGRISMYMSHRAPSAEH